MTRLFPLSRDIPHAAEAQRWVDGERWDEVVPRRASTVMLVRDADNGTEVFMLRRVKGMAFAPKSMVFPGGGVDVRDGDPGLPWIGPDASVWADLMGCDPAQAQMHVAAAVREVFEECGVLLASVQDSGRLADVGGAQWREVRRRLVAHEISLGQVLKDAGLSLRADLLGVKAHWVTPSFEPRRFDTWFFAALMPTHQVADGETSEADHSAWVDPDSLLADQAAGRAILFPPTIVCLEQLREAPDAADFVRHAGALPLILPEGVQTPAGLAMRID